MTLRHWFLICLLLPLLGACGDSRGPGGSGLTASSITFVESSVGPAAGAGGLGVPVLGARLGPEGFALLYARADAGHPFGERPTALLISGAAGHAVVHLGEDSGIASVLTSVGGRSEFLDIVLRTDGKLDAVAVSDDGTERHFGATSQEVTRGAALTQREIALPGNVYVSIADWWARIKRAWSYRTAKERRDLAVLTIAGIVVISAALALAPQSAPLIFTFVNQSLLAVRLTQLRDALERMVREDCGDSSACLAEYGIETYVEIDPGEPIRQATSEESGTDPNVTSESMAEDCDEACAYRDFPPFYIGIKQARMRLSGSASAPGKEVSVPDTPHVADEPGTLRQSADVTVEDAALPGRTVTGAVSLSPAPAGTRSGFSGAVPMAVTGTVVAEPGVYSTRLQVDVAGFIRVADSMDINYDGSVIYTFTDTDENDNETVTRSPKFLSGSVNAGGSMLIEELKHPDCNRTARYARFSIDGLDVFFTGEGSESGLKKQTVGAGGSVTFDVILRNPEPPIGSSPNPKPSPTVSGYVVEPADPVVAARFEMGGDRGDIPVLIFDQLYDPDDFDGIPVTGFQRGITGVDTRVVADGVDPATPFNELPTGTYNVEITAWDNEGASTVVTVSLVIP